MSSETSSGTPVVSTTNTTTTSSTTESSPAAPTGEVEESKFISSDLSKLKRESPEVFQKAIVQSIQQQVLDQMRKAGERMKKAMRKARENQ